MTFQRVTIWFPIACWVLAGGILAGCRKADAWKVKTYPASGTVIINGKPAEGVIVNFHPIGKPTDIRESIPWGKVQPDGTYHLRTYQEGDGAPPGEYHVTLKWKPSPSSVADKLNHVYQDPEKSVWKFTIAPGQNDLPQIELKNVKVLNIPSEPRRSR